MKPASNPFGDATPRDQAEIERRLEERRLEREKAEKPVENKKPMRKYFEEKKPKAELGSWRRTSDKPHEPRMEVFGRNRKSENISASKFESKESNFNTKNGKEDAGEGIANVQVTNAFALLSEEN